MDSGAETRLTLRGIEVFVAVVEECALGAGARRLGASASAVSQQIANLEAALGARLIDRAARPFALTPAGQLFHARAVAILGEIGKARAELADVDLTAFRRLRLAIVDEFDDAILPRLLEKMAAIYPDCSFAVRSGLSHENLAALESRSVDLIIAADLDEEPDWAERHGVLRDPFLMVVSEALSAQPVEALLQDHPLIRYSQTQVLGRLIEAHLRRLRLSPPRRFEIATNAGVLSTVRAMEGWAVTSALAYGSEPGQHRGLIPRALPFPGFARTISVTARRDQMGALPARVAAALRLLLAEDVASGVGAMPWLDGAFRILTAEP
ncbi:MAG: LysR family transcriptional regulator [Pseudomonadota bacterium]